MKAGRELDKLIAEKVIGLSDVRYQEQGHHNDLVFGINGMAGVAMQVPCYSTSITAAWEVVNKMQERHRERPIGKWGGFQVNYDDHGWTAAFWRDYSFGDSPEHAICSAALKAVGYED